MPEYKLYKHFGHGSLRLFDHGEKSSVPGIFFVKIRYTGGSGKGYADDIGGKTQ